MIVNLMLLIIQFTSESNGHCNNTDGDTVLGT